MTFLVDSDFSSFVSSDMLTAITTDQPVKMDECEKMAKGYINGYMTSRFDIAAELAKTGADRNDTLIRWMLSLSVYFLFNSLPDTEIPDRITKNYDDACKEITEVSSGKRQSDIQRIEEGGTTKTVFRWGSAPKRSHDPFQ